MDIKLKGIKINIGPGFIFLMILLCLIGNGKLAIAVAVFSLIHEYAHAFAAKKFGYSPTEISTGLFGGVLHLEERHIRPQFEIFIHGAGPFSNLFLALIFYLLMEFTGWGWAYTMVAANILLALFNLLPFYPLDGGKILNVYLSKFLGINKSYYISRSLTWFFSIILFLFGLYLVQYNIVNLIICALAVNLYLAGKEDSRYSFTRLKAIYTKLEEVGRE